MTHFNIHYNHYNFRFWCPPPVDFIKLKCDGAMVQSQSMTSCGGVIRDYKGHFIRAFLRKLRSCLILEAELWSLLFGMMMLKDAEMPNVIIESDCLEVVHLVNGGSSPGHTFVDLVDEICKLKEKFS